jgi:hypothetical protein
LDLNRIRRREAAKREADEKEQAIRRDALAAQLAVKRRREEEYEAMRQAEDNAKNAAEEEKRKAKQNRKKQERILKEKRWSLLNVTTGAEKQRACLYTEFWPKAQKKRNFKCVACEKKGGMIAFKCPHCSLLTC